MIGSTALPDFNPGPDVAGWSVLESRGSGSLTHAFSVQRAGRRGVLRVLHPDLARIPELGERFLRDPMIANEVQHPFCVRILDAGHHQELPFLVSELADGQSVADLLRAGPDTFSPAYALKVMCGALEILDVAHGKNIIHRDLRPESIVVSADGGVWIRDFGFARLREIGGVAAPLAFVPPERLSQGTGALDARGDLFGLGAICFNLLTGETPLARASSSFDRPSFGLLLPDAPLELIELVDRALVRDPERRYQSAADMYRAARRARRLRELEEPGRFISSIRQLRTAVAKTQPPLPREELSQPRMAAVESIPAAPPLPHLASLPHAATQEMEVVSSAVALEPVSDHEVRVLRELFAHWERSLRANLQYGPEHPESQRAKRRAWQRFERALGASDGALLCNLSPYAFVLADEPVWEPTGSFERIPYRLFADGVRVLGFRAGMTFEEWDKLSECLLTDLDDDPLNDFTTLLWDADLSHVVCQVVDVLQEGDGREREALEEVRRSVVAVARFDSQIQLAECWLEYRDAANQQDWQAELERSLGATGRRLSALLDAEGNRIKELSSALEAERSQGVNRFVYVASSGLLHALRSSSLPMVLVPLEQTLNRLGAEAPQMRLECALALIETAGRDSTLRETLIARLLTPRVVEESVLSLDALEQSARELLWVRLARLLDENHAQALASVLGRVSSAGYERAILGQLVTCSRGNEAVLGQALLAADLEQALILVRALARGENQAARPALMEACAHPEPVVRLEALSALGASADQLNLELKKLLEDESPEVRLLALRTVAEHEVKVVGPALALRIRSEAFDDLPLQERALALEALAKLLPSRAEDVSIELLERTQIVATRAHDETRELAAELLGRTATGADAESALQREQGRRFRNSERVRDASARALDSLRRRTSVPPPPGDPER